MAGKPRKSNDEYVNMTLPSGETTRFKRVWSGHRFTDREVDKLINGMEIRICTPKVDGVIGSLDFQSFQGIDYFGFAPIAPEMYTRDTAPFPLEWNGHVFTPDERAVLQQGERLLLLAKSKTSESRYGVNVTFDLTSNNVTRTARWMIVPHFEEFNQPASDFTRETCPFTPMFGGQEMPLNVVQALRRGMQIPFQGISKNGHAYRCLLTLELDSAYDRWRVVPHF